MSIQIEVEVRGVRRARAVLKLLELAMPRVERVSRVVGPIVLLALANVATRRLISWRMRGEATWKPMDLELHDVDGRFVVGS